MCSCNSDYMEDQLFQKLLQHKALRSFVHLRGDMNTVDLRVFNPGFLIPTMKPLDKEKPEKAEAKPADFECACFTCPSQEACKAAQEAEKAAPVEEKIDFSNVVIEPLFQDQVDFETFSKSDFRAVKVLECEAVPKSKKLLKFTLDDGSGENRTILSGIHAYYEPEELIGKTCIAITNLPPRAMMGIESCGMLLSAVHKEGEEEKLHLLMVDPHIPAGAKLY